MLLPMWDSSIVLRLVRPSPAAAGKPLVEEKQIRSVVLNL
jgi:hypothetical protein